MSRKKSAAEKEPTAAKPPLSEIFAALSGVIYAGIGDERLFQLGAKAADFSYGLRTGLYRNFPHTALQNEKAALKALAYLKELRPVLLEYGNVVLTAPPTGKPGTTLLTRKKGGTALDIFTHIGDMLTREGAGTERVKERMNTAGMLTTTFEAPYLPEFYESKRLKEKERRQAALSRKAPRPQPAFV